MEVQEFLQTIDSTDAAPVYLFCPHRAPNAKASTFEPLLVQRAIERLIKKYVDPSMRDLALTTYYADEADPGEVASMALTVPFLTERRVVVVHNAERYESETIGKPIQNYLAAPSDLTVLVLVAPQADKRTKFYKVCQKAGVIVESPELKPPQMKQWIRNEIAQRGKTIDASAVELMAHRCGAKLGDVQNAVTVVCNYVGEMTHIGEAEVNVACSDVAEEQIWTLTDAIAASNTGEAVRALRELLGLGKSEFEIMGSITWLLKSAYAVAKYGSSGGKLNPYVAQKIQPLASKIGLEKMPAAFALCMDTEILLRSTGVDRGLALELLVIKLAVDRKRPAAAGVRA